MKRHILGLSDRHDQPGDGTYLVRVEHARYHWHKLKPYYAMQFIVTAPAEYAGQIIRTRLYANVKALWKLNWFLRDFGYNPDLLGADELDEKALVGLQGVVNISRRTVQGREWLNVDGFAPANGFRQGLDCCVR